MQVDPNISDTVSVRLGQFHELVCKWTKVINLVSRVSVENIWTRHIQDSIQVFHVKHSQGGHWVDLGSGGGFPGIVVAILAAELDPELRMTLVESDQRKATFLRTALRELGLNGSVIAKRVEDVPNLQANVISARALAPLVHLIALSQAHMAEGAVGIFPKGARWQDEIYDAQRNWQFTYDAIPSTTAQSVILRIEGISRV